MTSSRRFWFQEVRVSEKREESSALTKGFNSWSDNESEIKEEKLSPENQYLEDLWKRKSEG